MEQRGAGLDICRVRQDPKGGVVSWPQRLRRINPSNVLRCGSEEERRGVSESIDRRCPKGKQPKPAQMHGALIVEMETESDVANGRSDSVSEAVDGSGPPEL